MCLSSLRRGRVEVPRRISVAGFDDRRDAFSLDLTSYNFNSQRAMSAIVSYMLDPRGIRLLPGTDHGAVEIEGRIVERATTGPSPAVVRR